jgi:hypothetical protein
MKRNLGRILELRELLEEVSRLDLEKKRGEMLLMESAGKQQGCLALEARADAMRILTEERGPESWRLDMADVEILGWKEERLRALAAICRTTVERARNELLERRLDRRQVEALIRAAERLEKQADLRREQQRADEWYQQSSRLREERRK